MNGWRKSRWSMANGNCPEVRGIPCGVQVRDTADRSGPVLTFPAEAWARFLASTAGGAS